MKPSLLLLSILCLVHLALASAVAQADEPVGSICIAPLPEHAREADHDLPGGRAPREYTYDFSIQIDSAKPIAVPRENPVLVSDLRTDQRHLIRIRDGETTIESFWFSFPARKSNHLCLAYGPWYQTWTLGPPRHGASCCKCERPEG